MQIIASQIPNTHQMNYQSVMLEQEIFVACLASQDPEYWIEEPEQQKQIVDS